MAFTHAVIEEQFLKHLFAVFLPNCVISILALVH